MWQNRKGRRRTNNRQLTTYNGGGGVVVLLEVVGRVLSVFPIAALAQLAEQQFCKLWVPSANLGGGSNIKFHMRKTYIDKLAFIEIWDRKVLETLSRGKDKWYIPGGKRVEGETDQQALIREVKEELAVDLIPETIKHYGTFEAPAHGKLEGTSVRMTCYTSSYKGVLRPSAEVEKMDWFDYSKKEMTSPVDHLIFDDLKQKNLID